MSIVGTAEPATRERARVTHPPRGSPEIQSVTAKGSLRFPGQHCELSILDNTEFPTRAPEKCAETHVNSKSDPSPLRVHFSFKAKMATCRLWTLRKLPPARGGRPTRRAGHPKSGRSPLKVHFDFQATLGISRPWVMQDSPRARVGNS